MTSLTEARGPAASGWRGNVRDTSITTEGVRAVCFPRDDARFTDRVQDLVGASHPGEPSQAAVQALLREHYRLAVVSPRHVLAALDGERVWYAFRDGSLVPVADQEAP